MSLKKFEVPKTQTSKVLELIGKNIAREFAKSGKLAAEYQKFIGQQFAFRNSFLEKVSELAKTVQESFEKAPESIRMLASHGWHLDNEFTVGDFNRFSELITINKTEVVENDLIEYFDSKIKEIEKQLILLYPHRSNPLKAAFKAHRNRNYYLSIPVFFAQIEGICQEVTGIRFFKDGKKKPATTKWAEQFKADSIYGLIVEPLHNYGPSRIPQARTPKGINRHDVLHGTSCDYGEDKVNGYKTLSLLNYVGLTIHQVKTQFK